MKKLLSYSLSLIAVPLITVMPVLAQKPASSVSVKIGYFNEALVKASFPEAAGSETLKAQAESQLRKDLDDANKQIQQMQEQKKPSDEIQKAIKDAQISINAKQQALAELVQSQNNVVRNKIVEAVNTVGREKGLDLVINGEGLFMGGKTVLDSGADITNDIVKKLIPQTLRQQTAQK
jgi:Skp family chaperone for outer membrane proteins